jgi:hypothetical protein
VWEGSQKRPEAATARQIRDYREKYPDKAIICDYDGLDGWSALAAGASVPPIRGSIDPKLLVALPRMQPEKPSTGALRPGQYALAETGRNYLVYSFGDAKVSLELASTDGPYAVRWIDPSNGSMSEPTTANGGGVREFSPPSGRSRVLWITRE